MKSEAIAVWDVVGIALSFLCLLHCLFLPAFVSFLPAVSLVVFQDESFHRVLAFGVTLASLLAFIPGVRLHGKYFVPLIAAAGILLILGAAFYEDEHWGKHPERWLTLLGGTALVSAHFLNRSFCRQCFKCRVNSTDSCGAEL